MKVTFNYKAYRWACIAAWLFIGLGFIIAMVSPTTLEETSFIGYIAGSGATIVMLGFGAAGIIWEMKNWFKKVGGKGEETTAS